MEVAVGSELSRPGDIADASVASIRIKRDPDESAVALSPDLIYGIGGLKFVALGASYRSNRVSDPTVPVSWEHPQQ